jgi:hypothetical protein
LATGTATETGSGTVTGRYLHMLSGVVAKLAEGVIKPCVSKTVDLDDLVGQVADWEPCQVGKVLMVPSSF